MSVVIGEVGEMESVARHAHPDIGLHVPDELELKQGRCCGAGACHEHGQSAFFRRASYHLTHGMNAERKRAMNPLWGRYAGAVEDTGKTEHRCRKIAMAAGIEQRPAGGAAGAPVLRDAVTMVGRKAEVPVKLRVRNSAQHILVEKRNPAPFGSIVQAIKRNAIELALEEGSPHRLLHGVALTLGMNPADLVSAAWGRKLRRNRIHVRLLRRSIAA